ncbi:MAG: polyphenol oxidase family protein [Acidimicrobiaceae bacterium]|nr:polyphenol oxidase family protein [Acidimicrobiaceae bacterium]
MASRYDFSNQQASVFFLDNSTLTPPRESWPAGLRFDNQLISEVTGIEGGIKAVARPYQYHSNQVRRVERTGIVGPLEADGLVTELDGFALAVLTADCVPVAFSTLGAVGIAHCGWKGIVGGMLSETVKALREMVGDPTARVEAAVGPHICVECYEFEGPSKAEVTGIYGDSPFRTLSSTSHLDLGSLITFELGELGVRIVYADDSCTLETDTLNSFRRDRSELRQTSFVVKGPC